MKYKKAIILLAFAILLCISTKVNAGELELNNLKYDVKLNSDGSASVTETWDIYIEDTNTLFKTFEIDKSKYAEITDVSVKEISNNRQKEFRKINTEMYHVTKDSFYALVNKDNKFEIAWGVQIEDETRTYQISYTIIDAVKNYNDCSEFYWQFISTESEIPAKNVEGIITLPITVTNEEEFRVWAHGPLNGNIEKISSNTARFNIDKLRENTMVEARIVTPKEVFVNNENIENRQGLKEILEQEQKWADEANAKREREAKRKELVNKILVIGFITTNIIGIVVAIIIIKKIVKYHKILKENPKIKPEQELEWYRDIPDENATPAQAGLLYYFNQSGLQANITKVVSATMLDLCMKKYLQFEVMPDKKDEIKIILLDMDKEKLSSDEKIVYEMLEKVNKEKAFTMKEFKKYCEKHSSSIVSKFSKIEKEAKKEQEKKENYKEELIKLSTEYTAKAVGYLFLMLFSMFLMFATVIPSLIILIYSSILASRFYRLTQKGINERAQWIALKKYMEEFSMIDEKSVPELVLWEKYLVYATAFGIADKVLKQLKVVYPQITDAEYMRNYGYSYMHLMYMSGLNNSLITSIDTSVRSTYNSINYSSGSGSGGGFSGGGGFGGGGGRNGR